MTMLHVTSDERGLWRVFEDASPVPLSEHTNATAAELAAWRLAGARHAESVVLHDRYGRAHALPRRAPQPTSQGRPAG